MSTESARNKLYGHGRVVCEKCGKIIITCRCLRCGDYIIIDICDECEEITNETNT